MASRSFARGLCYAILLVTVITPGRAVAQQKAGTGFIRVDGQLVQSLTLNGRKRVVQERWIEVPAGTYLVEKITLGQAGKTPQYEAEPDDLRVAVPAGDTVRLRVGAPLDNTMVASRRGSRLGLQYRLRGIGGEEYRRLGSNRSSPPSFVAYAGTERIGEGAFRYG